MSHTCLSGSRRSAALAVVVLAVALLASADSPRRRPGGPRAATRAAARGDHAAGALRAHDPRRARRRPGSSWRRRRAGRSRSRWCATAARSGAQGFGYADRATQAAPGPDTMYGIASVSKILATVATMQLVDQGKVDLDAPDHALHPDLHDDLSRVPGDHRAHAAGPLLRVPRQRLRQQRHHRVRLRLPRADAGDAGAVPAQDHSRLHERVLQRRLHAARGDRQERDRPGLRGLRAGRGPRPARHGAHRVPHDAVRTATPGCTTATPRSRGSRPTRWPRAAPTRPRRTWAASARC